MTPPAERWYARSVLLILAGGLAALLYANFILDWVLRGFSGMSQIVSLLEAPGQPNGGVLRVTDVVCALLVMSLLPWVRAALPPGVCREICICMTVLFALGAIAAAIVATPCGPGVVCHGPGLRAQISVHYGSSIASDSALFAAVAAAWLSTRPLGPLWFSRTAWWLFWLGGVVSNAVFAYFNSTRTPDWAVGASQRVQILSISAWIFVSALLAAWTVPRGARRKAGSA